MEVTIVVTKTVSSASQHWKHFENRCTFAEVMINSQVYCFLRHTVGICKVYSFTIKTIIATFFYRVRLCQRNHGVNNDVSIVTRACTVTHATAVVGVGFTAVFFPYVISKTDAAKITKAGIRNVPRWVLVPAWVCTLQCCERLLLVEASARPF